VRAWTVEAVACSSMWKTGKSSGWKESNINILTENNPPYEPAIGSTNLRAIRCRAFKE